MKKPLLILLPTAALLAAGAAWHHWSHRHHTAYSAQPETALPAPPASSIAHIGPATPPPDHVTTDSAAIFKKAFWRDPSPEDHIAHAERREWRDGQGVTRWEWFLEVAASPALVKYLRDDNAFGLLPVSEKPSALPETRPAWFDFNPIETDAFTSRTGKLRLHFSKKDNKLYASNAGQGFQRGAPAPATASTEAAAVTRPAPPGRLPTTPPPIPSP